MGHLLGEEVVGVVVQNLKYNEGRGMPRPYKSKIFKSAGGHSGASQRQPLPYFLRKENSEGEFECEFCTHTDFAYHINFSAVGAHQLLGNG